MSTTSGINPATASYHAMQHSKLLDPSLSRLSTGIRIQSGADDASGLTVSERLRNQIRGLNRAMFNVQSALTRSQTAGGALQETQSMLLRMRELSIQAQNDAMNQSDRLEIQKEVDQLINEIDKIASSTEFNQKKLLDGTTSSRYSVSPPAMKIFQIDEKSEPIGSGNYDLKILHNDYGQAEIQRSAVQLSKFNFEPAGANDRLENSSLFDDFLSFGEVNIEIQSTSGKVVVVASSSMSNAQLAQSMEQAITKPVADGGLGIDGSTFRYEPQTGQFVCKAGLSGDDGELHFLMPENWKNSLGLEVSEAAKRPSFHVIASQNGQVIGADLSSGKMATPVPGLKLDFPPPMPAEAVLAISHTKLGDEPIIISITSTNSHAAYAPRQAGQFTSAPNAGKAVIVIEPNPNLSFADIVQQIETQVQATAPNLGMNISIVGNQVFFVATESGESSLLDIKTNKAGAALFSSDIDPPTEFYVTGSGGTEGSLAGTNPIAPIYDVPVPFQFRFYDQDGGSLVNSPLIPAGPISYNDLMNTTNDALRAAGLKLSVYDRLGDGSFQVYSTEIGTDTLFQMDIHVPEKMIEIPGLVSFTAVDRNRQNAGAAGLITFGATTIMRDLGLEGLMDSQTALAHNSDTVSLKSVAGIGDVSAFAKLTPVPITVLKNTENTEFDIQLPTGASLKISLVKALPPDGVIVGLTMDELDESLRQKLTPANLTYNLNRDIPEVTIRSRELGKNASFSVAPTPEIGFIKYSGYGHDSYSINMQESRQVFQVGANQSQQVRIGIGNMESASLGVKNLQVGSVKQATDALHRLDAASNIVMATQAKLGAFENRMQHVSQSLQQTALNITSADSRIRDTDIAHESVLQSKVSMQQDLSTQIIKRIPQMTKRLWEQLLAAKQSGDAN